MANAECGIREPEKRRIGETERRRQGETGMANTECGMEGLGVRDQRAAEE